MIARRVAGVLPLGKTAAVSGEVHRYAFPRSDLQVTVDGVAIKLAKEVRVALDKTAVAKSRQRRRST